MLSKLQTAATVSTFGTARRAFTAAAAGGEDGMFKKILIANRGEIACRVIESAKRMKGFGS